MMDNKLNFAEINELIVLVNQEISELKMCMAKAEFNSCDERIIEPLTQMFAAAKEDGVNLVILDLLSCFIIFYIIFLLIAIYKNVL